MNPPVFVERVLVGSRKEAPACVERQGWAQLLTPVSQPHHEGVHRALRLPGCAADAYNSTMLTWLAF